MNSYLLSSIIWLPILSGLLLLIIAKYSNPCIVKLLSLISTLCSLLLSIKLLIGFDASSSAIQFKEIYEWIPSLGIYYALGVDGFSVPLIILNSFMMFLVVVMALREKLDKVTTYLTCFLVMQGLINGAFAANDMLLFYMFFEAMLIPMFLIIGIWGGSNRVYATIKFFLYTFFGSIFLLIAIIYLHYMAIDKGYNLHDTFSIFAMYKLPLGLTEQRWIFWALLIAFAIKVPMWPLHTWLPDAHVEAPTGGSVILAAITLKLGGYGMLRFLLPIVPDACRAYASLLIIVSLVSIAYVALITLVQLDMKKLVAYSSVSHMGFVTLAIFAAFPIGQGPGCGPVSGMGLQGAVIQMLSHGLISGAMFFAIGALYSRIKSRKIADFGGIVNVMPRFAVLLMIFSLGNIGMPGTSGFIGEFMIIMATLQANFWYAVVAATTLVFGASYTLWMYKRVIFGKITNNLITNVTDLDKVELLIFAVLAGLIILIGIWPAPLLELTHNTALDFAYNIMQPKF